MKTEKARKRSVITYFKMIEPGYLNIEEKIIEEQIEAIESCGYEWIQSGNKRFYRHSETGLYLNIKGLHVYTPEDILDTYESVWSKQDPKQFKRAQRLPRIGCLFLLSFLLFFLPNKRIGLVISSLFLLRIVWLAYLFYRKPRI